MSALLDVSGLTVRYGGVVAVDAVDVAVQEGAVFGLIGPNGAGKTSMVDALTGYTKPAAGRVEFDGRDITRLRPYKRARMRLARTFQSIELFDDLTVDENLLVASEHVNVGTALRDIFMPHRPPDRRGVDWAISVCGLEDVVDRFPSEISHGKRKLVGVGRALALEPRLVLLDEPAAGLDTDESLELGQKLQAMPREHGVTVFLIDHDMGLVLSVCDQLMVLDFGKQIASGTPTEIRQNQDVIEAYLGTRHGDDSD
ncbi:MAG TPA: ABC transporter ATP-binding protein [Solirubrobacteraceae bacterium]|jgi:branched-chain amino acid transport system ATP-binding protein|nr:ABC transporter ATP-binding protein [Solirubrobacteraceae bacterium]